jgi:hypothetical protein
MATEAQRLTNRLSSPACPYLIGGRGTVFRAYPNNRFVMRPSEKSEAKAAGQKGSEAWFLHVENVFGRQRRHWALQPAVIERVIGIGSYMQNKPNFREARMKLNFYSTRDYENQPRLRTTGKQTQSNPPQLLHFCVSFPFCCLLQESVNIVFLSALCVRRYSVNRTHGSGFGWNCIPTQAPALGKPAKRNPVILHTAPKAGKKESILANSHCIKYTYLYGKGQQRHLGLCRKSA